MVQLLAISITIKMCILTHKFPLLGWDKNHQSMPRYVCMHTRMHTHTHAGKDATYNVMQWKTNTTTRCPFLLN